MTEFSDDQRGWRTVQSSNIERGRLRLSASPRKLGQRGECKQSAGSERGPDRPLLDPQRLADDLPEVVLGDRVPAGRDLGEEEILLDLPAEQQVHPRPHRRGLYGVPGRARGAGGMITRVEISGFRALKSIAIDLQDFQVFVGPNASGKSTFFDALAFVRDVLRVDLKRAITGDIRVGVPMRARDPRDILWKREGQPVEIALTARVPESLRDSKEGFTHVRYELAVEVGNDIRFRAETLWLTKGRHETVLPQRELFPIAQPKRDIITSRTPKGWRKVVSKTDGGNDYFRSEKSKWNNMFRLGPTKSALANLPEDQSRFPIAIWFKQLLMEGIYVLALNAESMRRSSMAGSPAGLLPDGSNLPWVVHALEENDPEMLTLWVEHLRTSLPDIRAVHSRERPEDRSRYLEVTYTNNLVAPSWLLSDGTLRMIALTLIAYASSPPPLLLIEEPENGIHPHAMEMVIQSLSSVYDSQVFCATHSPLILSVLKAEQLLCFAKTEEGAVDVVAGDQHPALKNWKAALHLGDLLAMGVLG